MGDRFDRLGVRHANVEALLRRPGIGHNNGPTFDMSWEAWVWRRATAKAWKTPKPEVARMRLARAERLGITYKELASVIMDSGAHLGAAVLPLSLAARVRRGPGREIIVEPRNSIAELVARFRGRLLVLGDIDAVPAMSESERAGHEERSAHWLIARRACVPMIQTCLPPSKTTGSSVTRPRWL